MRRAFNRLCPFLTCLLALASLADEPRRSTEPPRNGQIESGKQAVKDDDYRILEVVLLDLIDFKEFDTIVDGKKKTDIVLGEETIGSSFYLGDGQLSGESHDKKPHLIPSDCRVDLSRRNLKEPVSLRGFKPSSPRILVRDLGGVRGFYAFVEFGRKYPDARGYVDAWLPGYSKDGQSAVLRVSFGPTPHGATATYMLAKKEGRWTVVWRKTAFYA